MIDLLTCLELLEDLSRALLSLTLLSPKSPSLKLSAIPATDCWVIELSFCGATVSGFSDCLHSKESSITCWPTPRLMTTHDVDPFSLDETICASMPYLPKSKVTFASWMGPKIVLTPNTPYASAEESSRMAEYSRHIVVILIV